MSKEEYYTKEDIMKRFSAQTYKTKASVLFMALGYMQQYNGRSKEECICFAMGYQNETGESDKWTK